MPLGHKGVHLRSLIEANGAAHVCETFRQAFAAHRLNPSQGLSPRDFSLLELAEGLMGDEWVRRLSSENFSARMGGYVPLIEADAAGVDSSAFSNITGQIIYNAVLDGYSQTMFVADRLVTTVPTTFHDGEKIPGVTRPLGLPPEVKEGMPYPEMMLGEDWINTPATIKNGNIVSLTKEAIAKDRTGLVIQRATDVGERVAYAKEVKVLDPVLGITNPYNWRGTGYSTYLTSGGWINSKTGAGSELLDWTQVEDIMVQLSEITNPFQTDTAEPIPGQVKQLLVMPFKEMTARRIFSATEVRAVSNTSNTTLSANPLPQLEIISSAIAQQRIIASGVTAANSRQYYYGGDFKRSFLYMQVFPLMVVQAAPNADAEFERDIVMRFKAAERGVTAVRDPRYVAKRTTA